VWHELLTTDPRAASSFYSHVIGWETQEWEDGYTMWVGCQGPLGGTMSLPENARRYGVPPHWTSYVEVADVEATAARARDLGGRVFVDPTELPKLAARFAVIGDPQGASIYAYEPFETMDLHDPTRPGEFMWSELLTSDHDAAFRFYSALFGWQRLGEYDLGSMGAYLLYGVGEKQLGGMFTKTKEMRMPPAWTYYVEVDGLDACVAKARAKGGVLLLALAGWRPRRHDCPPAAPPSAVSYRVNISGAVRCRRCLAAQEWRTVWTIVSGCLAVLLVQQCLR
jgi:predicted enzyme related to lactoylglutathione lyase